MLYLVNKAEITAIVNYRPLCCEEFSKLFIFYTISLIYLL